MKIGFVFEPLEESQASGMGYAVAQTARFLLSEGSRHEYVFFTPRPINQEFVSGKYRTVVIPKGFFGKLFWFARMREDIDVLVYMLPLLPLWIPRRIKAVPIFHELGSQKTPVRNLKDWAIALVRDRLLMPITLTRAARIISISQATTDDIVKHYGVDPARIHLGYVGYQDWRQYEKEAPHPDVSLMPYFFFSGRVKLRKNVHGLVDAFITFRQRTKGDYKLVVAGLYGGEYYELLQKRLEASGFVNDVHFLGYVDNPRMYTLITNATACIFPSLNEGFGMPIIEAMSLGTPVITSNVSSLPEVAGGAALLVDPTDSGDISRAMERISQDEELRKELIEKGKRRAEQFSWPKAAREYIAIVAGL